MRVCYRDEVFDGQFLRTLSHCCYGGADWAECWTAARQVPEKDTSRWYEVWMKLAARVQAEAERSRQRGHPISAHDAFLRASNYYRNAYVFLLGQQQDGQLRRAYDLHCVCFGQAIGLLHTGFEEVRIPYEKTCLRGYFLQSPHGLAPRPTLILNGGYDSTAEECYLWNGVAALRRGYHCLIFDGPGQGFARIEQGLPFRPDWENVIQPVVDWLRERADVDGPRIGIIGLSFGGYLALRATSGDQRLAACVADPGQFSVLDILRARLPGFLADSLPELRGLAGFLLRRILQTRMRQPTAGWALRRGLWVHKATTVEEYMRQLAEYTLDGRADRICCPTLVCFAEDDDLAVSARKTYDALTSEKEFMTFRRAEGAGEHCEAGARLAFHQRVFDWLDEQLHNDTSQTD